MIKNAPSILIASPGICIVEPLEPRQTEVFFTSELKGKIGRGKVLSVGEPVETDFGAIVHCPVEEGAIVYFLRYESGYDEATVEGKTLVFALFRDIRAVEK